MTPYLFCFASAMVMLTEYDENMSVYLSVTPLGKRGYVLSRPAFPAALSFLAAAALTGLFSLTRWQLPTLLLVCLLTAAASVLVALFLFSFSRNRVEGMAMAKLAGLVMGGLAVPFFMKSGAQYLFAPLPSFWIAKLCLGSRPLFLFPALLVLLAWLWPLYGKFKRKLI
jgi:fluoroquinolone transport system permease protein